MKKRIFDIIQIGNKSDLPSRAFDIFIACVILTNILVLILQTFDGLAKYFPLLRAIEAVTILIFCVEYALRLWTACYLYPGLGKVRAALRYMFSFNGIVDLFTILPFFFLEGFVVFRMMRVVRIFRLFQINSSMDSFNVIISVLYERRNQLLSSLFIIMVLMVASSLFLYSAEHDAQPDKFQNAFSGIWWSMSTLLTVGYGDIYPITVVGRIMAIVLSFLGVGVVAIPTGIISAGFVEIYRDMAGSSEGAVSEDVYMLSVVVDIDSAWLGRSKQQIRDQSGMVLLMARRDGKAILPEEDTSFAASVGDVLILYNEADDPRAKRKKVRV